MQSARDAVANVKEYYGSILQKTRDLKTNACCTTDAMPPHLQRILRDVHPEVLERFYGCGSPIPAAIEGCVVLDLGCGTGRDAYLVSKLVGDRGRVIGVDMTEAQLDIALRHVDEQMGRFGFSEDVCYDFVPALSGEKQRQGAAGRRQDVDTDEKGVAAGRVIRHRSRFDVEEGHFLEGTTGGGEYGLGHGSGL